MEESIANDNYALQVCAVSTDVFLSTQISMCASDGTAEGILISKIIISVHL